MAGPYKILEKVGNSYKLELPILIKVHPVIPPDCLYKVANNPLPRQVHEPPPAIEVNGKKEWEVKEILAIKKICGKL